LVAAQLISFMPAVGLSFRVKLRAAKSITRVSRPPQARFRYSITLILLLWPLIAQAKINVVATLPDFGSLAREIGKDKIEIVVLGKPNDDPHFVEPNPNFVASLHNADVLIDGGAGLEFSWLPPLLQKARNPKVDIGKPGRVQASQGIRLMNIPTSVTHASSQEHSNGNPHFTVDPLIAKAVAQRIAKSFMAVDPPNAAFYDAN
jgi:zinc/manganese transport system substrate-binding protein